MSHHLIIWDLETVPDLKGRTDDDIRAALGDKFAVTLMVLKDNARPDAGPVYVFAAVHLLRLAPRCLASGLSARLVRLPVADVLSSVTALKCRKAGQG